MTFLNESISKQWWLLECKKFPVFVGNKNCYELLEPEWCAEKFPDLLWNEEFYISTVIGAKKKPVSSFSNSTFRFVLFLEFQKSGSVPHSDPQDEFQPVEFLGKPFPNPLSKF